MFNTANILEALKNYIRTRGGSSKANNIAEAVNDLNSIPQSSGGAMVVTFTDNPDDASHPIVNKTPQEAMAALTSMPVLGVINFDGSEFPAGNAYFSGTVISFMPMGVDVDTGRILYYINGDVSDNVWTLTGA